jgi:hypothetical protein
VSEMDYSVDVEDIEPEHWVAYVFALPGCFSSGETEVQALSRVPQEVKHWFFWMSSHAEVDDEMGNFPAEAFAIGSVESFCAYSSAEDPEYTVPTIRAY